MIYTILKIFFSGIFFLILYYNYQSTIMSDIIVDFGYLSISSLIFRLGQEFKILENMDDVNYDINFYGVLGSFVFLIFSDNLHLFIPSALYGYVNLAITGMRLKRSVTYMIFLEPAFFFVLVLFFCLLGFSVLSSICLFLLLTVFFSLIFSKTKLTFSFTSPKKLEFLAVNSLGILRQHAIVIFVDIVGFKMFLLDFKLAERIMNILLFFNGYVKNKEVFNFVNHGVEFKSSSSLLYIVIYNISLLIFLSFSLPNFDKLDSYLIIIYFCIAGSFQILTGSLIQINLVKGIGNGYRLALCATLFTVACGLLLSIQLHDSWPLMLGLIGSWAIFNGYNYVIYNREKV